MLKNFPPDDNIPEPIEPLSAAEERRHARYWQRMVLPGGEQRTIDMRVIEPYKRVLSHGGYLMAGGHTAIVLFSACYLPDRSRIDYDYVMDNLFLIDSDVIKHEFSENSKEYKNFTRKENLLKNCYLYDKKLDEAVSPPAKKTSSRLITSFLLFLYISQQKFLQDAAQI
ncbi:hypothetical protein NQ317_007990 [Molorchus minor]|uniref:Uncharacterized protein n=1 Tax=Molorchus minor TaxID=1323400 RepID=A0ABQ9JLC1_9CUCU|nr:hypothetical protein NQ317_007990 [Molorchus minor]